MPFGAGGFPGFTGFGGPGGGAPGGGGTSSFRFSTGGGGGGSSAGFSFSNPESIFAEFLRGAGGGVDDDDSNIFASFGALGGGGGGRGGPSGGFGPRPNRFGDANGARSRPRAPSPEVQIVEKPLPLTLEELFKGTHKKMKIKRKAYDAATGKRSTQDKILDMEIKPGLKAGSKIKFKGGGDQDEGRTQDLHFIVQEKPHPTFKRDNDNLRTSVEIGLNEALTGWQRTVSTIDGRQLPLSGAGPTQPGYEERFPGLGMPKSKKPTERGDLIVTVNVRFPQTLSADQKRRIREVL